MFDGVRIAHPFSCLSCGFALCLLVFLLCLVYLMLPMSLGCPLVIVPSVFSIAYLSTIYLRDGVIVMEIQSKQ